MPDAVLRSTAVGITAKTSHLCGICILEGEAGQEMK